MGAHPEREGRGRGGVPGGAAAWVGHHGGRATRALVAAPCSVRSLAARMRNKTAGRKEKRREGKEKKKGRKKRKIGKKSNLEIYEKIKDNLWSWSKIIFVKERYIPNYK
jgi:hypothetical protein